MDNPWTSHGFLVLLPLNMLPPRVPSPFLALTDHLAYMLSSDITEDCQVNSGCLLALETTIAKMAHQNKMNYKLLQNLLERLGS